MFDFLVMVLRITGVMMAAGGGAIIVRGLFNGPRVPLLGVAFVAGGVGLMALVTILNGGEFGMHHLGPVIRGAIRALLREAF